MEFMETKSYDLPYHRNPPINSNKTLLHIARNHRTLKDFLPDGVKANSINRSFFFTLFHSYDLDLWASLRKKSDDSKLLKNFKKVELAEVKITLDLAREIDALRQELVR
jgi:hypothetical protein